jgi:cell wall-associated NlpC family hydrolase
VRFLRPLRLLLPFVTIAAALALFIGVAFVAFSVNGGAGGGAPTLGACDTTSDGRGRQAGVRIGELSQEQHTNAATIISVARSIGAPPRAWLVALATAMQESTLRNLNYGDRDSLGLFQQRPSQGWGSPAQVTDPVYSTKIFLDRLMAIPGWETLPVTVAAQAVQRSGFPDAYAKWETLAAQLMAQLADVTAVDTSCGTAVLAPGVAGASIGFALHEVGKPYVWGATGPNSYDCSGLMLRAFGSAGITLPRVSWQQYQAGGHVPVRQAQPGDLLFLATDPTDPSTIHHVMLYMGNNEIVEAPYTGASVRVVPAPWNDPELVPLATRAGTTPNSAA